MYKTLSSWLTWQESLHHSSIDLGLDRVQAVLQRLHFQAPSCPVITISGTKGKGSCAAILASIYSVAGYRVGLFTSPHLRRYNERIRINQQEISDESLCVVFERINAARGEISLTYFEFNTLAALLSFSSAELDVWILEVGMGGRLDAVNVIDADVAIVTSIGLDHTEWLGDNLESIGREKAGIFRTKQIALYAALEMPASIQAVADELQVPLLRAGRDFGFITTEHRWSWWMKRDDHQLQLNDLPMPGIAGRIQLWNASVALSAVHSLTHRLPLSHDAIDHGLSRVTLRGRFQRMYCNPMPDVEWILDVAHNPMSAAVLAEHLREQGAVKPSGKTVAIIGMLADKDVHGTVMALHEAVDAWIVVGIGGARALSAQELANRLEDCDVNVIATMDDVAAACEFASQHVSAGDRILVCGSFMTVEPALQWFEQMNQNI